MRFAAAILAAVIAVTLAVGCGESDEKSKGGSAGPSADEARPSGSSGGDEEEREPSRTTLRLGRWRVTLTARPSRIGPIEFTVRDLRPAKPSDSRPWIQHEIVYHNAGELPLTFADLRGSAFIGEPHEKRLLAADEGCGYSGGGEGDGPVRPGACLGYLRLLTIEPDSSRAKSLTLFKDLTGMDPLRPGTYVYRHPVRFQLGSQAPDQGDGRAGRIKLIYDIAVAG